jgi:undecaprenyl-diphosphatase
MLEVTILAVLQGIAEFLPISSSGHLVIGQHLLGVPAPGLRLDVFLHVGTLVSIVVFYRRTLARLAKGRDWAYGAKILLSTLPAVTAYLAFGDAIASVFENARAAGTLLMVTGLVLLMTRFLPRGAKDVSFVRAGIMGVAQMVALLPGISRSGMTLVAARASKVDAQKAAEFSFLMSLPLIAGAAALELVRSFQAPAAAGQIGWGLTLYGAVVAAVTGYAALSLLVAALKGRWFWLFGVYCLFAGLATILWA